MDGSVIMYGQLKTKAASAGNAYDLLTDRPNHARRWLMAKSSLSNCPQSIPITTNRSRRDRHPRITLSSTVRSTVWLMTKGRCFYCGIPCNPWVNLTIDHILPLARGGTNNIENLVVCCSRCNFAKGTKLITEWRPAKPFWFLSAEYAQHYAFEHEYTIWDWYHDENDVWEVY